ncbi:MAG: hypothetical protein GX443_10435 [Deltaproteobacteria bacterium]|nr:hypothetical protein [Deltaproteobacteria bacterium]
MSGRSYARRKRPYGKVIGFGMLTAALYAAVYLNAPVVMTYFTKGGVYAVLPIATVFLFSYVHGTFAGSLWSLLGIDAKRTRLQERMEKRPAATRKISRPRPRLHA